MITLHPKPGIELLAVEVPEDAKPYILDSCSNKGQALFYTQENNPSPPWFMLPYPGNYSFIATTKSISEEQAAELVEWRIINYKEVYRDYSYDGEPAFDFEYYESSLFSLIRSQGGDPDKHNYAILKREG